ncbi:MAG: DUF5990 family protein [Bacteroidota bacterium]
MNNDLSLRIVLQKPPAGVDFGLQKGSGNNFQPVQIQRSGLQDLIFTLTIQIKGDKQKDELPGFVGPFAQGPVPNKFIYLDIGTIAGQFNSCWSRRLKIPLTGITWDMVEQVKSNADLCLETHVAGTAKDGGPNCATVKPFEGWKVIEVKHK